MDREKQIEEMARTMCGEKEHTCEECDSSDMCEFWTEASTLYSEGYRKQSEGEWIEHEGYEECNHCQAKAMFQHNFCPNCGAKMSGGKNG